MLITREPIFIPVPRLAALAKPFGLVGVHTGVSLATLATLPLCSTHGALHEHIHSCIGHSRAMRLCRAMYM